MRRVVIQDRSKLFRDSLKMLLHSVSPGLAVEAAIDGEQLAEACQSGGIGAFLFEVAGVPWNVVDLVNDLRSGTEMPILVGTYPSGYRRHRPIDGVLLLARTSSCEVISRALKGVPIYATTGSRGLTDPRGEVPGSLTRREFHVLALIAGGLTTAQIATRLGISGKTVENRRQTLFAKLGVQNQSHAITVAMRTGLLSTGNTPSAET